MKDYKYFRQFFTKEEWEKFEANMSPKKPYQRSFTGGWGYEKGLEKYKARDAFYFLDKAFPWDETPEGSNYWGKLQEVLKHREGTYNASTT